MQQKLLRSPGEARADLPFGTHSNDVLQLLQINIDDLSGQLALLGALSTNMFLLVVVLLILLYIAIDGKRRTPCQRHKLLEISEAHCA